MINKTLYVQNSLSMITSVDMHASQVICSLASKTKHAAILEVIDTCTIFSSLPDLERFKRAVFRREHIETTGIGHGVAIAHGKILGLDDVYVALGISKEGIAYDSIDGKPIHLLFVIASSPRTQLLYLKKLSKILQCARKASIREAVEHLEIDDYSSFFSKMVNDEFPWLWKSTTAPTSL